MFFIPGYFTLLAYLALVALSPNVTVVPDTWYEWARIAVLATLALLCQWWGQLLASRAYSPDEITLLREMPRDNSE